jgi:hypothetical protein
MIEWLAISIALVGIVLAIYPFLFGQGGALASASYDNSAESLRRTKRAILERYLSEEKSFADKQISERTWQSRKQLLTNRYIDAARWLDFVQAKDASSPTSASRGDA